MRLPTYWARQSFTTRGREGFAVTRTALGWSADSQAEADRMAGNRARAAAARQDSDEAEQYDYGDVPPREPLIDRVDVGGETVGVITRNRYGCLVLNTDRVLFADIDLPTPAKPSAAASVASGWQAIVGRFFAKPAPPPPTPTESPEEKALASIHAWASQNPGVSLRVYRTFAGLRLLFTHRQFSPTEPAVDQTFKALGADTLYMHLTRRQQSFRARLSPKPWRCGASTPCFASIIETNRFAERQARWVNDYTPAASRFATCRLITKIGTPAADPQIGKVVDVHDGYTIADDKPLA